MKNTILKRAFFLIMTFLIAFSVLPINAVTDNASTVANAATDTEPPVISDVKFTNISVLGYTVTCKVTDNTGVLKVSFPTWTVKNDQDDLPADFMNTQLGTKNGDYYTFRVKASEHNNETGAYATHIYAVDLAGNTSSLANDVVQVTGTPADQMVLSSISKYTLTEKYIKGVKESSSVYSVLSHFENEGLKVYDLNGAEITGKAIVGTGMYIKLYLDGAEMDSVAITIPHDVDGDGIVSATDCMRVKATLLETYSLNECQFTAADDDEDGELSATDYIRIKHYLLNAKTLSTPASKPSLNFDKTLSVTPNGTTSKVVTASGVSYTAMGYGSFSNNVFSFTYKVTSRFDTFNSSFNRITLCYFASNPLKCTVKYVVDGATVTDLFYLEAGTQTFCALINGYLDGKQASSLSEIQVSPCESGSGTFGLYDVKTEVYDVFTDDVYYMENDYYKLGVRMRWGGGICYLYDFVNREDGIKNLINQADTGRLVQQSYYGTFSNGEYVSNSYNSSTWPYNPVQGGDRFNNPSRIVDIVVGKNSLYIKAQPQDWAHNGDITPSYMENLYVLEENRVRVDNRFVDFSGWEHRYASQELPAFYTVSYLDNFTYYAGSASWTDAPLTSRNDLKFWGGEYHNDCEFRLRKSNKETWCAWTNSQSGYGIGLFVPNVDVFLAGRHAYSGTKDSNAGPTNYVAPINNIKMVSYYPIEYSYMITTGSVAEIRATFKANKDFASNESLHTNYRSARLSD